MDSMDLMESKVSTNSGRHPNGIKVREHHWILEKPPTKGAKVRIIFKTVRQIIAQKGSGGENGKVVNKI